MPDMSYNTIDGNPPMSLATGGTNLIPQQQMSLMPQPQAPQMSMADPQSQALAQIVQHPVIQNAIQAAAQKAIANNQVASGIPSSFAEFQKKYPGGTQMMYNQINNLQAMKDAGLMDTPYSKAMQQHPILMGLSKAAMAFGQGITKQPFLTDFEAQQNAMLQSRMQNASEMARYGQLTPEQMINLQMRKEGMDLRQESIKNTQDQRDQTNWSQFVNKVNPATASSRSTLGMTANGNLRANRALATIQNNPNMTYQDLGNVIGDLAGIYQGGSPTDMGMKHQQYDTIQSYFANLKQWATGEPQAAVTPAIREKIMNTINSLKAVNNQALKSNLDNMEKSQKTLISKHPDEWQQFRKGVENDYMNNGSEQTATAPTGTVASQASQASGTNNVQKIGRFQVQVH